MTLKYVLPMLAVAATQVSAEEYQLLTNLQLSHVSVDAEIVVGDMLFERQYSENLWQLNGQYFFGKKQTLGPLDQFDYINKVTNVSAGYARAYDENFWSVGGEYFAENNLVISASFMENADSHATSVGIGYLVSKNVIIRAQAMKPEDGSTDYRFSASYNHQLQGNDYLGFSAYSDDEFDYYGISSKYFASIGGDRYITVNLNLDEWDGNSIWATGANYYFSQMTSVGLTYAKDDNYGLNAKHFFNRNWALQVGYNSNTDSSDSEAYHIGVTGQF